MSPSGADWGAEPPRPPRWVFALATTLAGVLAGLAILGAAEVFVRFALDIYECDPTLGWTFRAGAPGLKLSRHAEFLQPLHFNSHGFNDEERSLEKPPDTFRILLLGDSIAASLQVPREQSFPKVLEHELGARLAEGKRLEVVNTGVDGFGTAQQLLLFQDSGWRYRPDIVLLQMYLSNDLVDNWDRAGDWNHHLAARCGRPYLASRDGKLEVLRGPQRARSTRALDALLRHFTLYASLVPMPKRDDSRPAFLIGDVFSDEPPPALEESWDLTQRLVLALREQALGRSMGFVVLPMPSKQAAGQLTEEERASQLHFEREYVLLQTFLEGHAIPYVDVMAALRRFMMQTGRRPYFVNDSHLNEEGHAAVAAALRDGLANECARLGACR